MILTSCGSRISRWWGADPTRVLSAKTYAKTKELGPVVGQGVRRCWPCNVLDIGDHNYAIYWSKQENLGVTVRIVHFTKMALTLTNELDTQTWFRYFQYVHKRKFLDQGVQKLQPYRQTDTQTGRDRHTDSTITLPYPRMRAVTKAGK